MEAAATTSYFSALCSVINSVCLINCFFRKKLYLALLGSGQSTIALSGFNSLILGYFQESKNKE